jgi:hypothetical protein
MTASCNSVVAAARLTLTTDCVLLFLLLEPDADLCTMEEKMTALRHASTAPWEVVFAVRQSKQQPNLRTKKKIQVLDKQFINDLEQ